MATKVTEYKASQIKGIRDTQRLVNRGVLVRPDTCQLCGWNPGKKIKSMRVLPLIIAHHWRGYDHPEDVWWICRSCNLKLSYKHDGSLSLPDAKRLIWLGDNA